MKISTRIGVLRMISTYAAVSWLTTGTRWARAAPRTTPMTNAPAMATADTFSVFWNPWKSSSQLVETKPQRSKANSIGGSGEAARRTTSPGFLYGQTVSTLGAVGDAYENVLFGRRMLFENDVRKRAGTLAFRIGKNRSFDFMRFSRESTHALRALLPCLMPMPNGACRKDSLVSFELRSA